MKWAKENEASIIDLGSPLGKTKRIDATGISDTKNEITAYTIVKADPRSCRCTICKSSAFHDLPWGSRSRSWNVCRFRKCSENFGHPCAFL